jgi:hypothetical protein
VPDDEAPTIRPYVRITDDLILRIDAALEKTMGHRGHAAMLLGLETKRFSNVVYNTPALKAKWGSHVPEVPEVGPASEMHRDPAIPPFTPEETALVEAYSAECDVWSKGLTRLNFTAEKKAFLEAVQASHGSHWKQMSQMFQGGVSYTATELLFQFNKINSTIEDTYANPANYERRMENQWGTYVTKTAHEVRCELIDRALHIAEMFRKLNADSERATLISAQVEKLKFEELQDVKKRAKPGFGRAKPAVPVPADGS